MLSSLRNTFLLSLLLPLCLFAKDEETAEFCLPDLIEMSRPAIRAVHRQFDAYTVAGLAELIRFPSVSTDPDAIDKTMNRVAELMKEIAPRIAKVKNFRVNGPNGRSAPYVFGHWVQDPSLPTVLVYAHGDVQPAVAEKWKSKPFGPALRNGRLYGRGATDNKSGILIFLSALRALAATGPLPVNVKFIVEAEEEIGSPNFKTFCNQHSDKLKANAILIADSGSRFTGVPALTVSTRGALMMKVKLEALKNAVHGGIYGGAAPNPLVGLIQLLASLTNERQEVVIPGFLEGVQPVTADERRRLAALGISAEAVAGNIGLLPGVKLAGKTKVHPLFAIGRGATANFANVVASEPGAATIPSSASASLALRLPPGLDAKTAYARVEAYLQANRPLGMKLTVEGQFMSDPWNNLTDTSGFRTATAVLEHVYGGKPVQLYNEGGSLPLITLLTALNDASTPIVFYGADEPGNNIHGNNESVGLVTLRKNVKATVYFLGAFGQQPVTGP